MPSRGDVTNRPFRDKLLYPIAKTLQAITLPSGNHEQNLHNKEAIESDLEVVTSYTDETDHSSGKEVVVNTPNAQKRSYPSLLFRVVVVVIIGVAVGAGLGIGLPKRHSMNQQSIATQQPAVPTTTPVNPSATAGAKLELLDGTSFAALNNGASSRHVFFQDAKGSINHATYQTEWLFEDIGTQNARNLTPLSAFAAPDNTIYLFYITTLNVLAAMRKQLGGSWQNLKIFSPPLLANGTRQLDAINVPSFDGDTSTLHALVLTEFPGSVVTTLHLFIQISELIFIADAIDMCPNAKYTTSAPCAVAGSIVTNSQQYGLWTPATTYSWTSACSEVTGGYTQALVGTTFDGKLFNCNTIGGIPSLGTLNSTETDMQFTFINNQLSVFSILNSQLSITGGNITGGNQTFPYPRMASFTFDGSINVYHQTGVNTITEQVLDTTRTPLSWNSSNITSSV